MSDHVMLDLETWGTRPGCALRSIGAVLFSTHAPMPQAPTFYANITKDSCLAAGLAIDPRTEAWWAQQSPEAVAALEADQRTLAEVVIEFHIWFRANGGVYLWSHGANFDEPIWAAAADKAGFFMLPWRYWNVRDTRTLFDLAGIDSKTGRSGIAHNALDDAKHQAELVRHGYSRIHQGQRA